MPGSATQRCCCTSSLWPVFDLRCSGASFDCLNSGPMAHPLRLSCKGFGKPEWHQMPWNVKPSPKWINLPPWQLMMTHTPWFSLLHTLTVRNVNPTFYSSSSSSSSCCCRCYCCRLSLGCYSFATATTSTTHSASEPRLPSCRCRGDF